MSNFTEKLAEYLEGKLDELLGAQENRAGVEDIEPWLAEMPPIDMVLHCPACGRQHIDEPEEHDALKEFKLPATPWTNPPHRSHLCHGCGCIWRPADVPTNGVQAVKTKGKNDSKIVKPGCLNCATAICDECDPKRGVR